MGVFMIESDETPGSNSAFAAVDTPVLVNVDGGVLTERAVGEDDPKRRRRANRLAVSSQYAARRKATSRVKIERRKSLCQLVVFGFLCLGLSFWS